MPHLEDLIRIFYPDARTLGRFTAVDATWLPDDARRLLAHQEHMTVTVEAFHGSLVTVEVLREAESQGHYAREIVLHRASDSLAVQHGIVRMNFAYVSDAVRRDIESRQIPLGRVLIEHNVLRQVQLMNLYRIEPGPALCAALAVSETHLLFGRTALIYCDGAPAVELLEIVRTGNE
jgi:chorismate-pyruvate lyase